MRYQISLLHQLNKEKELEQYFYNTLFSLQYQNIFKLSMFQVVETQLNFTKVLDFRLTNNSQMKKKK